jgi:hypothetical protein
LFQQFVFSEISPNAVGTAASSQLVQNASSAVAAGIACPLDDGNGLDIVAELIGATGGALDVYLQQGMPDGSWIDVVHFPSLTSGTGAINYKTNISALALNSSTNAYTTPVVVGKGTSPQLVSGAVVQGQGFDRLRLLMVAGSGTSAGAAVKCYVTTQRPLIQMS